MQEKSEKWGVQLGVIGAEVGGDGSQMGTVGIQVYFRGRITGLGERGEVL